MNYADVVVVKTGESLKIRFLEQIPDSAACVDYMLQGGGSYKGHVMFQQSLYEPFALNLENGVAAYPAERLMQSARRFSLPWCRRAVLRCGQTDLAMKSTGADGEELLIGLLMELAVKKGA